MNINEPEVINAVKPTIVNKTGPIIIIEDDADDQDLLTH